MGAGIKATLGRFMKIGAPLRPGLLGVGVRRQG
jgi:hypothetical protein